MDVFKYHPLVLTLSVIALLAVAVYLKKLLYKAGTVPILVYKDSDLVQYVIEKCPLLNKPLDIPIYARNTHLQTILPSLLPVPQFQYDRKYLDLQDGGKLALDWGRLPSAPLDDSSPVLVVLPGLTGGPEGFNHLCLTAMRRGFRCVVFNKRGHGKSELSTPKLQSFGDPTDLREVVTHIRQTYPNSQVVAFGSSAGSGLLASYLGEYSSSCDLTAGVCVSAGYNAERLFNGGILKIYEWVLLWSLKRLVKQHTLTLSKTVDINSAFKANRLIEFEDRLYRSMYGFEDMSQYWKHNCPMRNIYNVAVPCLCINSYDDPVCQKEAIPHEIFRNHPNVILAATENGGHCGFLHGPKLEPWANKVALDFLTAVLEYVKNH